MTRAAFSPTATTASSCVAASPSGRAQAGHAALVARHGSGNAGRSVPGVRWLRRSVLSVLSAAALLPAPPPLQAQPGAPDVPIAPIPPTKLLLPRAVSPEVHALRVESLASHCAACHGSAGRAVADSAVPGLAGMPAADLAGQLRAFKSGSRPATVMQQIAKGYSEQQIDQLAAYFAAQPK